MSDVFVEAYTERLQSLFDGLEQAITGLPVAALAWSPGAETNTLTVLAVHVSGATRYLIGEVAGGEPSGRVRAAEFATVGLDETALRTQLRGAREVALRVVGGLTTADLARPVYSPQHERQATVAWALLRCLDHLAEHVGHAQMTRQLWEQHAAAG